MNVNIKSIDNAFQEIETDSIYNDVEEYVETHSVDGIEDVEPEYLRQWAGMLLLRNPEVIGDCEILTAAAAGYIAQLLMGCEDKSEKWEDFLVEINTHLQATFEEDIKFVIETDRSTLKANEEWEAKLVAADEACDDRREEDRG